MSLPKFNPAKYRLATPATTATNKPQSNGYALATTATTATNKPPAPEVSPLSPLSPGDTQNAEKREPHFADIMALPIRPCTTCARLHWQQREFEDKDGSVRHYNARTCDHYGKTPAEPTKGCRCIHFERGRA